ncbi:TPA: ATP-binding protein [Enterobacter roggenkampii]|uniref:ATP-binding protein n=1 Tax=Enterobacter roggenkampii TaxID=1812935 RepID=UPI002005479C|nr:ATP-binding protein [Enterobacter roggenkampii]MCK7180021.1 ATP-binding protein [Enterobacter roggenkampii]
MARRLIAKKPFDFSARVTLQLGRESISSSTVAISELIKNSYDADAESVEVNFFLKKEPCISTLFIKDNGNGMDQETLFDYWLKIGTDNKLLTEHSSSKKRVLTGAKGLGRLGIDRLCKKLILFTKKEDSDIVVQLNVDWRNFENTNKSLHEIVHDVYEVDLPIKNKYGTIFSSREEKGTCLVLIGLKDDWNEDFLNVLSNELRLLISPYRGVNDFNITLSSTSEGNSTTKLISSEDIIKTAHWKIISKVDENSRVRAQFINNNSGEIVQLAPIEWSKWIKNQGEKALFGPLTFEFNYLPRDLDALKKLKLGRNDWKQFMDLNRGVRIYRDDFRVRPYGEPSGKGDWLDLGFRRASSPGAISQGGWRIGPHQIVGAINITREKNSILEDQANREGLFENDAFFQMRTFVLKIIEHFETLIHKDQMRDAETDLSEELSKLLVNTEGDVSNALSELKSTFTKQPRKRKKQVPPAKLVFQRLQEFERAKKKHEEAIENYYRALKKEKEKLIEEKDTLSNLASIGILTVCFGHEIRTHSGIALEGADEIVDLIHEHFSDSKTIDPQDIIYTTKLVKDSIIYVDNFSKIAINNIKPDKRQRKKINVPSVFEYIFKLMNATLKSMGVEYSFEFSKIKREDFNVRAYTIDWESIVINLLTNSLWALEEKERNTRFINVIFERIGGTRIRILFNDTGCGLEEGAEESIFLPMSSSKRDRAGNTIGTGMGLAIVKTHVEEHMAGGISAYNHPETGGATFAIELLQDVSNER